MIGNTKGNHLETLIYPTFWKEKTLPNKCSQSVLYKAKENTCVMTLNTLFNQVPTAGLRATSQGVQKAELVDIIIFIVFQTKKCHTVGG